MPNSRIPSPARSQGVISTPRKHLKRTRSVGSPARTNLRLSSIIESYKVSPAPNRISVLNDDTDIEMPRGGSWWKKIDDNSRDVLELLERKELVEVNNVAEEFDVDVLSQEKKNYTLDLPESSDGESISSIVIPQRVLFTQKDNQPQIKFGQIKNNRETLQKLNKSYVDHDKEVNIGRKTLFSQPSKPRTKPVFPSALLNISANKTANKTKEIPAEEVKGQVRSLFGSRPGTKRKNMFADFIVSESEDDIPEIQPTIFGFQKRKEPKRRASLISRHSHASSIDLEMEDWKQLPSSTMFEHQFAEATSPVKRIKLSNLLETKDSEINNTINKLKANKSTSSKNKSKNVSNIENEDDNVNDITMTPRNATINKSRVTRSMSKSLREDSIPASNTSKNFSKTRNKTQNNLNRSNESKTVKTNKNISQRANDKNQDKQNILADQPDPSEDFILKYNDDTEVVLENRTLNNDKNIKDKSINNLNVDVAEDKNNFVETNRKKSKENVVEQQKSINKICQNQAELLINEQNDIESNEISNHSKTQNNSQDLGNVVALNKDSSNVKKLNKSIEKKTDKNKSISLRNSVEKCNEHNSDKDVQKKRTSQVQNVDKDVQQNGQLDKSNHNLNEENHKDQEMESEIEQNKSDNHSDQHSEVDEETNESTQFEGNDGSEIEEENEEVESYVEENECKTANVTKEAADNEEQDVMHDTHTDQRGKELMLDDQLDNIDNSVHVPSPNVSHDTTGSHKKEIKSPELMLKNKSKQMDSFTVHGRDTSIRKSKSITFHNKIETVKDFTGFSDGTGNSSAEGSGWDSHRTTRKTLRQTFGKDFTPRKSLRALVMEKTAKLQANFTSVIDKVELPQANSTKYIRVEDELNSLEPELVQVDHDIEMVHVDERLKTIRTRENVQIGVSDVTDRLQERDKTEHLEERDEVNQFENDVRDVTEPCDEIETMEQPERLDKNDTTQTKNDETEREEMEEPEKEEEMEKSKVREDTEESEEEDMEKSEGEQMEESEEEEMEKSEEREEIDESEEEEMEKSGEKEEIEESEEEEMEKSEEREEMEECEEEEMEKSEERKEMEESKEQRKIEESESEGRNETDQFEKTDEMELFENKEKDETDQFEDRHEMDESANEERDDTERFEERDETVSDDESNAEESELEVSKRTRQTSLELYLQKIKQDNADKRRKMQEELRNSLKNPKTDTFNLFKVPQKPVRRTMKVQKPKTKQIKSVLPLEMLPSEFIEDMKYKPPKRFQPNNASWITKRLYKFLENKLEPKYDYKARIRAEKLVQCIYNFTKEVRRHDTVRSDGIEELKREMARLDIVKTHFDFYEFCHEFFPREIRIKVVPDIVNNISLPRHGVFSDILR